MNCAQVNCRGTLRVTHTYTEASGKWQRAVCSDCGTVHRLDIEATVVTGRGDGAKAHAARARGLSETSSGDGSGS